MTPLEVVISVFGNASQLSKLLGVDRSAVCRWGKPNYPGGVPGNVPARHHRKLLNLAKAHGKWLTLDDLCDGRPDAGASVEISATQGATL